MHFIHVNTVAGSMYVNVSHIVRISHGNTGHKLTLSDGYTTIITDPIHDVLVDILYPIEDDNGRITLMDNETA